MSEMMSELSDDQAAEALFNSIQEDTGRTDYGDTRTPVAEEESKPEATTPQGEVEEGVTPESEASDDTDTFTKLDPNAIPDELKPWYQSMQADYTRKTQQLSEIRKQHESLGDVDPSEVQAALTLFQTLQDPQGALAFHQQLSTTLTQMGLTPAQAAAEATRQIESQQTPADAGKETTWDDDPDAAYKAQIEALNGRLSTFEQQFAQREAALRQQEIQAAATAELDRQTSLIREANPHYTESDLDAVYELAAFHQGNLLEAQNRYEDIVADRVNRLMATKASAASNTQVQSIGNSVTAHEPPTFGGDLEAAHRAAMEHLRALEA